MPKKRPPAEQIIGMLRQAEVELAQCHPARKQAPGSASNRDPIPEC